MWGKTGLITVVPLPCLLPLRSLLSSCTCSPPQRWITSQRTRITDQSSKLITQFFHQSVVNIINDDVPKALAFPCHTAILDHSATLALIAQQCHSNNMDYCFQLLRQWQDFSFAGDIKGGGKISLTQNVNSSLLYIIAKLVTNLQK